MDERKIEELKEKRRLIVWGSTGLLFFLYYWFYIRVQLNINFLVLFILTGFYPAVLTYYLNTGYFKELVEAEKNLMEDKHKQIDKESTNDKE